MDYAAALATSPSAAAAATGTITTSIIYHTCGSCLDASRSLCVDWGWFWQLHARLKGAFTSLSDEHAVQY